MAACLDSINFSIFEALRRKTTHSAHQAAEAPSWLCWQLSYLDWVASRVAIATAFPRLQRLGATELLRNFRLASALIENAVIIRRLKHKSSRCLTFASWLRSEVPLTNGTTLGRPKWWTHSCKIFSFFSFNEELVFVWWLASQWHHKAAQLAYYLLTK